MSNYDKYSKKSHGNGSRRRKTKQKQQPPHQLPEEGHHYIFDQDSANTPCNRGYTQGHTRSAGEVTDSSPGPTEPSGLATAVGCAQKKSSNNFAFLQADDDGHCIQLDTVERCQDEDTRCKQFNSLPSRAIDSDQKCSQTMKPGEALQKSPQHIHGSKFSNCVNSPNITRKCSFNTNPHTPTPCTSTHSLADNSKSILRSDLLSSSPEKFHDKFVFHDHSVDQNKTTGFPGDCQTTAPDDSLSQKSGQAPNGEETIQPATGNSQENHRETSNGHTKPSSLQNSLAKNLVKTKTKPLPPPRRSNSSKYQHACHTNESAVQRSPIRTEIGFAENARPNAKGDTIRGSSDILEPCSCISQTLSQTLKNPKYTRAIASASHSAIRTSNGFLSSPVKNANPFSTCISLPSTPKLSSFGSTRMSLDNSLQHCLVPPDLSIQQHCSVSPDSSLRDHCPQTPENSQDPTSRPTVDVVSKKHASFSDHIHPNSIKAISQYNDQHSKTAKLQSISSPTSSLAHETFCQCPAHADDVWLPRDQETDREVEDVWLLRDDYMPDTNQDELSDPTHLRCNATHILSNPYFKTTSASNPSNRNHRHSSATLRHLEQYLDARSRLVLSKARTMVAEWQTIATVVDRLLFCITFFATVFAYIFLLVIAPHEHNSVHSDLNLTLSASAGRFHWTS